MRLFNVILPFMVFILYSSSIVFVSLIITGILIAMHYVGHIDLTINS